MDKQKVSRLVEKFRQNPKNVAFSDLCKVCEYYFGKPRQKGTSHRVYKTPWQGDPRVNIQPKQGQAKPYQVKHVLAAIDKKELFDGKDDGCEDSS